MNVLLAAPYKEPGGIARWTGHILRFWEANGKKDVDITLLKEPRPLYKGFDNKSVIRRVISGIYTYCLYCIREFLFLRKEECDILHICTSASLGLYKDYLMLCIAKWFHKKTIVHFRFGRIPELFKTKNWEYKMLDKVIRKADLTITIDKASYETLKSNGYDKITNIPNPISPDILDIVQKFGIKERDNRLVLFVGQCYKEKGIYELIDACRGIDDIIVRFVGSINDSTREEMIKRAEGMSNVEIIGNLPYDEVIQQMLSCAVFVLPTYSEGFPNVILESMACGCPIVTTDVGAIPEMLDIEKGSTNGICIKPRDVEALRTAICKMLDDQVFARQCGENAKQRVNLLYSMPQVWTTLVNTWNGTLM